MKQEVTVNIPANTKIESQYRAKTDKEVIKQKILEKEKLVHDKKIVHK